MKRLPVIAGYTAASVGVLAAILTPFVLIPAFTRAVAGTGLMVAPIYSGGRLHHAIDRGAYRILVNTPVRMPTPLVRGHDFVQITWTPAATLPDRFQDEIDIDGDGRPDLVAAIEIPPGGREEPRVAIRPLSGLVRPFQSTGVQSMTALIARAGGGIVLRTPLAKAR